MKRLIPITLDEPTIDHSKVLSEDSEHPLFGGAFEQTGGYLQITSDRPVISFALLGGADFLSAIGGRKPIQ